MLTHQPSYFPVTNMHPSALPSPPLQLRKKIQDYSFFPSQKIGKGFSSTVYRGQNDITKETVAIKVIQLASLKDDVTKAFLESQLQFMKNVEHENLLKCKDAFKTVNNCYIITEYCEEGDLQKIMRKKGIFYENQINEFFAQFWAGYLAFSQSGYIHRDIKPANIFLKDTVYKLADFGMLKSKNSPSRDSYNVGTPVYMPPQSLFSNIYSQKSDIWSIGVMCYQLRHGRLPFVGKNKSDLKENVRTRPVQIDWVKMGNDFGDFLFKCLEKDQGRRLGVEGVQGHPWVVKWIHPIMQRNKKKNAKAKNLIHDNMPNIHKSLQLHQIPFIPSLPTLHLNLNLNTAHARNLSPMPSFPKPSSVSSSQSKQFIHNRYYNPNNCLSDRQNGFRGHSSGRYECLIGRKDSIQVAQKQNPNNQNFPNKITPSMGSLNNNKPSSVQLHTRRPSNYVGSLNSFQSNGINNENENTLNKNISINNIVNGMNGLKNSLNNNKFQNRMRQFSDMGLHLATVPSLQILQQTQNTKNNLKHMDSLNYNQQQTLRHRLGDNIEQSYQRQGYRYTMDNNTNAPAHDLGNMHKGERRQRLTMDSDTAVPEPKRHASLLDNVYASIKPNNNGFTTINSKGKAAQQTKTVKTPKNPLKTKTLDYLITIINYLRYVYKIYQMIIKYQNNGKGKQYKGSHPFNTGNRVSEEQMLQQMLVVLEMEIVRCLNMHSGVIDNKCNVFNLPAWKQFNTGKKWTTYVHVVQQYIKKYKNITNKYPNSPNPQFSQLPNIIISLLTNISSASITVPMPMPIVCILFNVSVLYNMHQQIKMKGWVSFVDDHAETGDYCDVNYVVQAPNWLGNSINAHTHDKYKQIMQYLQQWIQTANQYTVTIK